MTVTMKTPVWKTGKDGQQYDVRTNAGFKAWEESFGPAPETLNVERPSTPGTNLPADPIAKARHAEAVAFIRDYRGTFGLILDLRAKPSFGTAYYHLSDRQVEAVLNSKARDEKWAAERSAKAAAPVARKPVEHGMYRKDGQIIKVQIAVHGSGKVYAKVLVIDAPGEGHFEYAPGVVSTLTPEDRMTPGEAAEFGRLYGICIVCSATLTDEESIARGIGPVCAGKA